MARPLAVRTQTGGRYGYINVPAGDDGEAVAREVVALSPWAKLIEPTYIQVTQPRDEVPQRKGAELSQEVARVTRQLRDEARRRLELRGYTGR